MSYMNRAFNPSHPSTGTTDMAALRNENAQLEGGEVQA